MSTPRLLLVCSAGGHLLQLHALLGPVFSQYQRSWVCLKKPDAESLLKSESVTWAYGPTNRSIVNLVRNLWLAWRLLGEQRPDVIITTGAGVGVPFIWVGRLFGAHTIFVESFARSQGLSLSGRLAYPVAHEFIVQHKALANRHARARYYGSVY